MLSAFCCVLFVCLFVCLFFDVWKSRGSHVGVEGFLITLSPNPTPSPTRGCTDERLPSRPTPFS